MKIYSVHAPDGGGQAAFERVHFESQGFSWPAILFGPFWLISRGLWRALALWCLGAVAASVAVGAGLLTGSAALGLFAVAQLYLGFQGGALVDAALERSGWRLTEVAAGLDRIEAERFFFLRQTYETPPTGIARQGATPSPSQPSVIGLFPETGG